MKTNLIIFFLSIFTLIACENTALTTTSTSKVEATTSKLPIVGTYHYSHDDDLGEGQVVITKAGGDNFAFDLNVVGSKPAYNQGVLEGEIQINENIGNYKTTKFGDLCHLQFVFSNDKLIVKNIAKAFDCGFGFSITAEGEYFRVQK